MNIVDQVFSEANQENPALTAILGLLLDGGKIVITGSTVEDLFKSIPALSHFEKRSLSQISDFSDLTIRDCLFVENAAIDQLISIAKTTGAQVIHITQKKTDESLADYEITEQQLRSALISFEAKFEKIRPFKGQINIDGSRLNKALFLDRDGVLIHDTGYVREASDVQILPGVAEGLRLAREKGYRLIVVTNQSGIGRGLIHWSQYEKVTLQMQELLAKQGIFFDRIVKAPYYEKSPYASGLMRKSLRKPRTGMIHQVLAEFRIDVDHSVLIGDSATDLMTGALAGVKNLYLLESGKLTEQFDKWNQWPLVSRFSANTTVQKAKNFLDVVKGLK